jgi:hypothetical protein
LPAQCAFQRAHAGENLADLGRAPRIGSDGLVNAALGLAQPGPQFVEAVAIGRCGKHCGERARLQRSQRLRRHRLRARQFRQCGERGRRIAAAQGRFGKQLPAGRRQCGFVHLWLEQRQRRLGA